MGGVAFNLVGESGFVNVPGQLKEVDLVNSFASKEGGHVHNVVFFLVTWLVPLRGLSRHCNPLQT